MNALPSVLVMLDLGNVLFHIEFERTIRALRALPGYNGIPIRFGVDDQDTLFTDFDRGRFTPNDFYNQIRTTYGIVASDEQLCEAWNAIIIEPYAFATQVPADIIYRMRVELGKQARVVLLSNASLPHIEKAKELMPALKKPDTIHLSATYYSYELGLRKPDADIFEHVCSQEGFAPQNTILFDDSAANVAAARGLGIRASRVMPGDPFLAFRALG